ncbi:spidroin-1-like, partial [Lathamus discolor]|uniref:spidroin-1-like n=1 Tax=Lathamus discolor TaxID=678569 RepID=UPI0032B83A99
MEGRRRRGPAGPAPLAAGAAGDGGDGRRAPTPAPGAHGRGAAAVAEGGRGRGQWGAPGGSWRSCGAAWMCWGSPVPRERSPEGARGGPGAHEQALEVLAELCESLDNATDFCALGGLEVVVGLLRPPRPPPLRAGAARVLGACAQNLPQAQFPGAGAGGAAAAAGGAAGGTPTPASRPGRCSRSPVSGGGKG